MNANLHISGVMPYEVPSLNKKRARSFVSSLLRAYDFRKYELDSSYLHKDLASRLRIDESNLCKHYRGVNTMSLECFIQFLGVFAEDFGNKDMQDAVVRVLYFEDCK